MKCVTISPQEFGDDRQGRTFADVASDSGQPFKEMLAFFSDAQRQKRMEDAEIHHDRPPLAGVVREFEAQPVFDQFLASQHPRVTSRFRQAVGVVVRMIMERRGWRKTGRKGSLGVRAVIAPKSEMPGAYHNTGGLAFWFLRAERYELESGMPYRTVRKRQQEHHSPTGRRPAATRRASARRSPQR